MKRIAPNFLRLRALYGFAGLVFGAAVSNAAVIYSNNFEGAEANAVAAGAGTGGVATMYAYGNQGGWTQVLNGASNSYWWYSTKYATGAGGAGNRPDPLGPASAPYDTNGQGATALHGISGAGFRYATRLLSTTFTEGNIYRFSVSAAADFTNPSTQAVYMYFFRASAPPTTDFDAQSSAAALFTSDGGSGIVNTSGGAISNLVAANYTATSVAGNWGTVSYDFTAGPSVAGETIGIAIYMRAGTAVDNIVIEQFVPEPGSAAMLAGSLGVLLARRRRK